MGSETLHLVTVAETAARLDMSQESVSSDDQDVFAHFCREKTEDGEHYEDEDIADHMVFLLLAAHDKTTSASTMAAYYLANDIPLQSAIADEVRHQGLPLRKQAEL
jgi:cytochrome P450